MRGSNAASHLEAVALPEEALEHLARQYQELDAQEKDIKERKAEVRAALVNQMSQCVINSEDLDTQVEYLGPIDLDRFNGDVLAWAKFFRPEYVVDRFTTEDGEIYEVYLVENPELCRYNFEVDGFKFGRTLRFEGADFDAPAFVQSVVDSSLPAKLKAKLKKVAKQKKVIEWEVNEDLMADVMGEAPETVPFFQRAMFRGKPKVAMLPISAVVPDE